MAEELSIWVIYGPQYLEAKKRESRETPPKFYPVTAKRKTVKRIIVANPINVITSTARVDVHVFSCQYLFLFFFIFISLENGVVELTTPVKLVL